mmetsp:Transcript_33430/g.73132  ORF Transcript_33430/g.73132 Transcript_33430/m.73132 type:complete len:339 (-) Transcript_33430:169-1185(-)|eukprot:CAMPEP_0170595424 /NCGR_PEP_ID=MMETSP0224-20130122/14555_1 /TAXON_ID=285029 /ORGANISM="Togula jolla, Strain CCCM 725" /LENGTH=338 /DNA_ID=CAMNT_0010919605 /DNA_START=54 /DNA_END=1070 /DNA_ORIENTATION=+
MAMQMSRPIAGSADGSRSLQVSGGRRRGERRQLSTLAVVLLIGAASAVVAYAPGFVGGAAPTSLRGPARDQLAVSALLAGTNLKMEPTEKRQKAKDDLMDLLDDATVQQEVLRPEGKPTRGRVDELILALERYNDCVDPAYSELIDGSWKVKYSASVAPGLLSSPTRELALFLYGGGFSLGSALSSFVDGFWGQTLGLKLRSKKLEIMGGRDVSASAEVEVAGRKETLKYVAELMPLSGQRMSEEILSVDVGPLGNQDLPLELRRSFLITYLDDDIMTVRDESGSAEVLVRKKAPKAPKAVKASAMKMEQNATKATAKDDDDDDDEEASSDPLISEAA